MTEPVTPLQLMNASEDADDLAAVVNGPADLGGTGVVTTRTGGNRRTLARLEADFQAKIDEQAIEEETASAAAALATAKAAEAFAAASGVSATGEALEITQDQLQWDIAQRVKAAEIIPPWVPTRGMVIAGNSISASVGSTKSTDAAISELIDPSSPNDVGTNYQVGAGTNMAEALAYLTANLTVGDKAKDLILTDPVAGEILTLGTRRYDFWKTDAVFNDFEAIRAMQTGGASTVLLLVASPADTWSGTTGNANAAYARWIERAMLKPYSADIINVRQHMIDWYSARTGFEALQREWNEAPLSTLGCQATPTDWRRSHSPIKIEEPLTLNHYEGEPLTPNATFNNAGLWVHTGPFGGGANLLADQVHPSAFGREIMARLVRARDLGRQGFAPFINPGYRFRTTANAAAYSVVGIVRMHGVADEVDIVSGDPLGSFSAVNMGVDANGYGVVAIIRAPDTSIAQGEHKLLVVPRKGVYQSAEFVRVMVMAASGSRVPGTVTWDTPICLAAPRTSVEVASCRKISFFADMSISDYSVTRYPMILARGTSQDRLFLSVRTDGRIEFQAIDATGAQVARAISRSAGFGGPIVTPGDRFTLLFAIDWENGLVNGRLNGVDLVFSGTGTTFNTTNTPLDLTDTRPLFLASQVPFGFLGLDAIPAGEVSGLAMYPNTYLDCAAVEVDVIDGSGNLIFDDPEFILGGVASHPVRVRGPAADLFAGGQDTSVMVLPTWRPSNILDAEPEVVGGFLAASGNLSELVDPVAARTNLGLGEMAVEDDAPADSQEYIRKNNAWALPTGGGGGGGGGLLAVYPPVSGEYLINSIGIGTTTTLTLAANTLYLLPLVPLANDITLSALAVSVSTAAAGSNIRLGVYPAGTDGLPDGEAPLADVVVSGNAIANVEGAVSLTLQAGTGYWLALLTDGTAAVRAIPSTITLPLVADSGAFFQIRNRRNAGLTYGALPTCPATSTAVSNLPIIGLKMA